MKLLLGSKSPRRVELLRMMGLDFKQINIDADESFGEMEAKKVAEYLAIKKSQSYQGLREDELLITADTTVLINGGILNKPKDKQESMVMLETLSGNTHRVVTGVCIRTQERRVSFSEETAVHFKTMNKIEIESYIDTYQPFDKAGSYGIQEGIGLSHISGITGCYYNVMGLPCARLYEALSTFEL